MTELDADTRSTVELLTSEIVTNAVRHGASDPHEAILIRAENADGAVRVEVCDEGDGFERRVDPGDMMEPGGNGLLLVQELSTRWGVCPGRPSCVWFEAQSGPALH
jgi:anti-sigma regulatory factor (Ser/Thr protein kinase)